MISDILRYIIYHRAFLFSRFDVQFYLEYVLQKLKPPRLVSIYKFMTISS